MLRKKSSLLKKKTEQKLITRNKYFNKVNYFCLMSSQTLFKAFLLLLVCIITKKAIRVRIRIKIVFQVGQKR
jgi:hypothetical protein